MTLVRGCVVALLATLALSGSAAAVVGNPTSKIRGQYLLTLMPRADRAGPDASPPSRSCAVTPGPCTDQAGRSLEAFMQWAGEDVSALWSVEILNADGPDWPEARQRIVRAGQRFHSRCGRGTTVTTSSRPFYCALDGATGVVYLPLDALRAHVVAPYTDYRRRDFAISFVVAHEWAHHLQAVIGVSGPVKPVELQADCLAGVWASGVWPASLVSAADVRKTFAVFAEAGSRPGQVDRRHGAAAERLAWFTRGWSSGNPARCVG